MSSTTAKSPNSLKTCEKCKAPYVTKTMPLIGGGKKEYRVPSCKCEDDWIDKQEKERVNNERRMAYQQKQDILDGITNNLFLGGDHGRITFEKLERVFFNREQIVKVESYLEDLEENLSSGKSFGLLGDAGLGKTALFICLHKELKKRGITSALVNVTDYFPKHDAKSSKKKEYDLDRLVNARVVFFDDMFRSKYTENKRDLLFRIVDYRYSRKLPNFFASNILQKDAKLIKEEMLKSFDNDQRMGKPIIDRLFNSRVEIITFVGEHSFRQRRGR